MMPKRRILVAVWGDAELKQRKIVVLVDPNATNKELSEEIAMSLDMKEHSFTLELAEGFQLRSQDAIIDTIRDGEIVFARLVRSTTQHQSISGTDTTPINPVQDHVVVKPAGVSQSSVPRQIYDPRSGEPSRIRVRLVTAEYARSYARANIGKVNTSTADEAGVMAFEGEPISGNTTLNTLRVEAQRVLGWSSEEDMATGSDDHCDREHGSRDSCSCAIAHDIKTHGLSSTLHCRNSMDGSHCPNKDCPYSHVKVDAVNVGNKPPHCDVCEEFLGFPCPECMNKIVDKSAPGSSVVHCPLVQNAGCGHIHHAHCLGRSDSDRLESCPSGCPREKYHREASIFGLEGPQIVIVWDGDKIDKIPVPTPEGGFSTETGVCLKSSEVVQVVEDFLTKKGFASHGLLLKICSRNPVTETVRFTQWTLVTVCHRSTRDHIQTVPLFADSVPPLPSPHFPQPNFCVDFHTSHSPIIACGCTRLQDLFSSGAASGVTTSVILYVVRRKTETEKEVPKRAIVSKEQTYLSDASWYPSVPQTDRGMAALLSSLYCFSKSVSDKGTAVERKVLSMLHEITQFPPAVRALGILFLNRAVLPEERAALSEALYRSLKDFLSNCVRAPTVITGDPKRYFETVRILLAHLITSAGSLQLSLDETRSPLEEISLICSVSNNPLTDPVLSDSQVVNRAIVVLRQPGGDLYRSSLGHPAPVVTEITDIADKTKEVLSHCRALLTWKSRSKSTMVLHTERMGSPTTSQTLDLVRVGRDFLGAIERANETDLVTRGPLDLKSSDVVPPQIVLDKEGLLAVFIGRACGSIRDVNFLRPTRGGSTEVDINDVSFALQNVIAQRKAEDTWQVDTFGGVSATPTRPPDEAIVLCLDLSQSMNKPSGVSNSAQDVDDDDDLVDHVSDSLDAVRKLAEGSAKAIVMENAKAYLSRQHACCYHAWQKYLTDDSDNDDTALVYDLLEDLGTMAQRDTLRRVADEESDESEPDEETLELAHFAFATDNYVDDLADYLEDCLYDFDDVKQVGVSPYDVPWRLIDPRTGDLLTHPVCPDNAPYPSAFVNQSSKAWFEAQSEWPSGYLHHSKKFHTIAEVQEAVEQWISGTDIITASGSKGKQKKEKGKAVDHDEIRVTLIHRGDTTTWNLSIATTTRILYRLAYRATKAQYARFTLRLVTTKIAINDSTETTLGLTDLSHGGVVEIAFAMPHRRRSCEVIVTSPQLAVDCTILLPQDASILALMSYLDRSEIGSMSEIQLWHDIKEVGDGQQIGNICLNDQELVDYGHTSDNTYRFECDFWDYFPSEEQKERRMSRHLSRLNLLKELFNVFINRASSFDTSVSLVLGLVTFSDTARISQELTPIFENFRRQLDKASATGDTAIYDALDTARSMLVNFRNDLPGLRKRIVIVTDGADTKSEVSPMDVCRSLQRAGIIVDSVQVGDQSDTLLHAISTATGGYRFLPRTSLSDALSIFDLETMLSSAERPPSAPKLPVSSHTTLIKYGNISEFPVDVVTITKFPHRTAHAKLHERVRPAASLDAAVPLRDDRMKRIMRELKDVITDPHPQIDLYVNSRDITFFKIILEAPKDGGICPYQNGTFLLTCDLPANYPRDPPEIRFVTFILHPNVSKQGKVCIAELSRLWSSDITLKEIFSLIYGLLLEPDLDNPVEIQASLKYYDDDGTYALAVAEAVKEHALKTREDWRRELDSSQDAYEGYT